MLEEIVDGMKTLLDSPRFCSANLHVSGLRTGVIINYLPGGIEITGFEEDVPPYVRLEGEKVFTEPGSSAEHLAPEEGQYYRVYHLWDPRVLRSAGITADDRIPGTNKWRAEYDIRKIKPPLPDEIVEIATRSNGASRQIEYVTDTGSHGGSPRLRQLSIRDISSEDRRTTLYFRYKDEPIGGSSPWREDSRE